MSAFAFDIVVERYARWDQHFLWTDNVGAAINLAGKDAKLEVRPNAKSDEVLLTLTDGDGITLGGGAGTIDLHGDPSDTAGWDFTGEYDLLIGEERFCEGTFRVKDGNTRGV